MKIEQERIIKSFEPTLLTAEADDIAVTPLLKPGECGAITFAMSGLYKGVAGTLTHFGGERVYLRWTPMTVEERANHAERKVKQYRQDCLDHTGMTPEELASSLAAADSVKASCQAKLAKRA